MDEPAAVKGDAETDAPIRPSRSAIIWAAVRYLLGLAQMTGAIVAFLSLMMSGLTYWTIVLTAMTTLLTVLSRLLFH